MTKHAFWKEQRCWPLAVPGYHFLGQFAVELGCETFGPAWTGFEPFTRPLDPLSPVYSIGITSQEDMGRAANLLREYDHEYQAQVSGRAILIGNPPPSEPQYLRAVELSKLEAEWTNAAFNRWFEVVHRIFQQCRSGELLTFARPYEGGALSQLETSFWNTEQWWQRFEYCQFNPVDPYGIEVIGNNGDWIFVSPAPNSITSKNHDRTAPPPEKARWVQFDAEVLRVCLAEGLPSSVHALADQMASWCAANWRHEPANSTIRKRLTELIEPSRLKR